jgi:hypothetical protein
VGTVKVLIELLDIVKLAIKLYRQLGYYNAKRKLIEAVETKDDKKTEEVIRDLIE